ncbi:MAG: transglutaminase family protein [Chloroflexi bacterium]|nr:transglutaminase family protein [Chloroflexota bacterium]
MYYSIRHLTRFRYSAPITESVMEVRMQPRTEGHQRCLAFRLHPNPRTQVLAYRDYLGNTVHYFDVPSRHLQLTITAEAQIELRPLPPPSPLPATAWDEVEAIAEAGEHWFDLQPSTFARPTDRLADFARELRLGRQDDPLTTLRRLTTEIATSFAYAPQSTHVDSPIDDALRSRQGVCQDFAHIMIALVRQLGIPCRYVSGYLVHRVQDRDRSAEDATHAWVEALLPGLGWVGFDPTNDLIAGDRHIRVAVGRDYADVPPTRGVFKGRADSMLEVSVQVTLADQPPLADDFQPAHAWLPVAQEDAASDSQHQQQ